MSCQANFTVISPDSTSNRSFYNVWSYKKQHNKPMRSAVRHLVSLIFFEAIVFLWYYLETALWHAHMAWLLMTVGVLFGEIVGRLIVAHLCHEDIAFVPRPMYALALPLLNAALTRVTGAVFVSPELVAIAVAALVLFSYAHFVSTTIVISMVLSLTFPAGHVNHQRDLWFVENQLLVADVGSITSRSSQDEAVYPISSL